MKLVFFKLEELLTLSLACHSNAIKYTSFWIIRKWQGTKHKWRRLFREKIFLTFRKFHLHTGKNSKKTFTIICFPKIEHIDLTSAMGCDIMSYSIELLTRNEYWKWNGKPAGHWENVVNHNFTRFTTVVLWNGISLLATR